ncbi:MAG TPA: hypothetical protein P5114_10130 [Hyphomicrobiaceae bacterium]|nr:hypothetical protein [Hyphomicrobiaceae bacterium]
MMRIFVKTPSYNRRLRKSRRGIMIASALTLAAIILTLAALFNGSVVHHELAPVAVESPINK